MTMISTTLTVRVARKRVEAADVRTFELVAADDKRSARLSVLEAVCRRLGEAL